MKDEEKKIEFHSDDNTTDRGFHLIVKQIECTTGSRHTANPEEEPREPVQCDRLYSTREAVITSVGYPNNYDNNVNCK